MRLHVTMPTVPLNESPSEKEGKSSHTRQKPSRYTSLNESPSEKEGKFGSQPTGAFVSMSPSMKAPPKRKGNPCRLPASP